MSDNTTSAPAAEFDAHVAYVNPYYPRYHADTLDLITSAVPAPAAWLDTGCGTGTMALQASKRFGDIIFTLADPSPAMLDIARQKLAGKNAVFVQRGSLELDFPDGSFDVVTAIQSHHYFDEASRLAATANCYRMLKPGGVYVTFENIRPFTDRGTRISLDRWRRYQLSMGRSMEQADAHLARFGTGFFPITVGQHLELLRDTGFAVFELLFMGMMQAGFYAIK